MFSTTGRSARSLCFVRLERPSSRDRPWAMCCESEFVLLQGRRICQPFSSAFDLRNCTLARSGDRSEVSALARSFPGYSWLSCRWGRSCRSWFDTDIAGKPPPCSGVAVVERADPRRLECGLCCRTCVGQLMAFMAGLQRLSLDLAPLQSIQLLYVERVGKCIC